MTRGDVRVTISGRGCCTRCGAALRRVRARGQAWCDPCRRAGPDPRRDLPSGFYFQDSIVAALADYDFATVFRRVRAVTGWSQQTLGNLVGLDQGRVSGIERGARRLRDVAVVAQVATALCIPPVLLGFGDPGTTVGVARVEGRKVVSWVDRRDFAERVAALTLGVAGVDIDRLTALLPTAEPTGTRHVGPADIEVIEQTTVAFESQDFATGAGPIRDLAVAQLRATLPLLGAEMTSEVRPRLYLATARLAMQAGWMSFEVNLHDAARRLWLIGLEVARDTDHTHGTDLTVYLLGDMATQAVHLGRPDEALRLIHLAHAATAGSHPVSAATTSLLAIKQARAHAAKGEAAHCDRALGQAVEHFSTITLATTPSWGAWIGEAVVSGCQGTAHYELALAKRDPHAANRAVPLLRDAVDHIGPDYARPRALWLTELAGAHAIAGDADAAVTVGHQALDAVTTVHSPRTHDGLRVLSTALEPLHTSTGVAELRDRLRATLV
ncbi:MAG: helix-turn-helix domain-containing protein [Pseudonocardiaceae bacterium]